MAEVSGPFFAPGEPFVTRAYLHQAQEKIADETLRRVHLRQSIDFKVRTGYYERHTVVRDLGSAHLIHDSDVVYGPWLEGVGSRNFPSTRFKGYSIMRKTTRAMQDRSVVIGDRSVRVLCEALSR